MNKVYGFEGECKAKHGEMTYQLFADVFTAREYEAVALADHSSPRHIGVCWSAPIELEV